MRYDAAMRRFLIFALLGLLGSPGMAADDSALQRADRLDSLFAQLRGSNASANPQDIELQIWTLWGQSSSAMADVLLNQGAVAMGAGEFAAAEKVLNSVVSAYPDYAEAYNKRATLYFMMSRNKDSLSDIDKTLDLEPRHFGALSGRGMILRAEGKNSEALAAFRSALRFNPHMAGAKAAVLELGKLEQDI
jgi:tetratricopeptide (TPR) repeat protein